MSPVEGEQEDETLVEAALRVLNTADPFEKAGFGDSVASKWLQGLIARPYDPSQNLIVPDRPARATNVNTSSLSFSFTLIVLKMLQKR